jgi:putative ABC transport system substrate-binding protein
VNKRKILKKLLLTLLFLIFSQNLVSAEQEIAVVQAIRVKPYEEAMKGFRSVYSKKIKTFIVPEFEQSDIVDKIQKIQPDIVLAIGPNALRQISRITDIPVIYIMVLNPPSGISRCDNITGVSMNIPGEKQVNILMKALPDIKRIGVLYDPDKTGHLVKNAKKMADHAGVELIARKTRNAKEIPSLLKQMRGKIDLFWMLPDITLITPETVEFLLIFSLENRIPILAFSEKYVGLGALMSIGIDAFDIGSQAGEMAEKILSGKDVKDIEPVCARRTVVSISLKIARKLGIKIDETIIKRARIVD